MKSIKLGDCATIKIGLVLKRKEAQGDNQKNYSNVSFTLKSFTPEGVVAKELLFPFFSSEKIHDRYLAIEQDVVMKRTAPYTAIAINKSLDGCVVPSFFVTIRLKDTKVINPGYLALYLNTDKVQEQLRITASGMTVPVISTKSLRELYIPILIIDKQEALDDLNKQISKERELIKKLLIEKENYYKASIMNILKEGQSNE